MRSDALPIAIIGAGPVGLAAAAHLVARGLTPLVLEGGDRVGAAVHQWRHVRVFSPWRYNVDAEAVRLLRPAGWAMPDPDHLPTGGELVEQYLAPLAALPTLQPQVRLASRVVSITRLGFDKLRTDGRESAPFLLRVRQGRTEANLLARAVIDASGTYGSPNPLGASGTLALGEEVAAERIFYGIPDVLNRHRPRYAGRHVVVVGSGHSAFNTLLDLLDLARQEPGTRLTWVVRHPLTRRQLGGGAADALPARGSLGSRVEAALEAGGFRVVVGRIGRVGQTSEGLILADEDGRTLATGQEVVAVTGFRPDLTLLRELRLDLDPLVEAPRALAPLIDPNLHSCGTVPPHGLDELSQPEPGFFVVGMKSYGRAPTFLMLTGYEQVRSIACALAGDLESARRVELILPATGVCSSEPTEALDLGGVAGGSTSCCGGPAPAEVDACCTQDADAKASGQDGCGCGATHTGEARPAKAGDRSLAAHVTVAATPRPTGPPLVSIGPLTHSRSTGGCCASE